jgi:hypothetical protein
MRWDAPNNTSFFRWDAALMDSWLMDLVMGLLHLAAQEFQLHGGFVKDGMGSPTSILLPSDDDDFVTRGLSIQTKPLPLTS